MYSKFSRILRLKPIGIRFWPYGDQTLKIFSAPKFWSQHKYYTTTGYHYEVTLISNDSISISLESTCRKGCIHFKPATLTLDDFLTQLKEAVKENSNYITLAIAVTCCFSSCDTCLLENDNCKKMRNSAYEYLLSIYFNYEDIIKALDYYENFEEYEMAKNPYNTSYSQGSMISSYTPKKIQRKKEKRAMKNQTNFLGIQCGMIDDPNVAATMLGICFKNEAGNWIKFDPNTKQRTDMSNVQVGNLGPLYLIPSSKVEVGTPIYYENEYYYVTDASNPNKLTVLSVKDGVEKTVYPAKNLLGLNFYAKVVALIDAEQLMGGDNDDLLVVMALSGGLNNGGDNAFNLSSDGNGLSNLFLLSALSNNKENGLGGMLSGILGDGDSSSNKLLPLLLLSGGMNGQGGNGFDMNTLLMLSMLNKKSSGSGSNEASDNNNNLVYALEDMMAAKKEPEKSADTLSKDDVAAIVKDTLRSELKSIVKEVMAETSADSTKE